MLPYKVPLARCDREGPDIQLFYRRSKYCPVIQKNFEETLKGQLFKRSLARV